MAGSRDTDGHNYYLLKILWKNVRQMCFKCPFYCVSNTSVSFPVCRKYECLRTHRSHFVRQMCSETNVLLQSTVALPAQTGDDPGHDIAGRATVEPR
jgi:hypothetical protein